MKEMSSMRKAVNKLTPAQQKTNTDIENRFWFDIEMGGFETIYTAVNRNKVIIFKVKDYDKLEAVLNHLGFKYRFAGTDSDKYAKNHKYRAIATEITERSKSYFYIASPEMARANRVSYLDDYTLEETVDDN